MVQQTTTIISRLEICTTIDSRKFGGSLRDDPYVTMMGHLLLNVTATMASTQTTEFADDLAIQTPSDNDIAVFFRLLDSVMLMKNVPLNCNLKMHLSSHM